MLYTRFGIHARTGADCRHLRGASSLGSAGGLGRHGLCRALARRVSHARVGKDQEACQAFIDGPSKGAPAASGGMRPLS